MLAHGFGGTKADAAQIAQTLARSGYTVITYTARGFGASGGLIHLGNPSYEGRDAVRVIDEAAARPEVTKVGSDPVIGFAGASYGGAAALMAAGLDPRVDAVVSAFTWHSLTQALVPQHAVRGTGASLADVTPDNDTGVFKQRWAGLFFLSGLQGGAGRGAGRRGQGAPAVRPVRHRHLPGVPADGAHRGTVARSAQPARPLLDGPGAAPDHRADADRAGGGRHAVHPRPGRRQLPRVARQHPAAMAWVEGGHDGGIDLDALLPQWQSWFDRYLRDDQNAPTPPTFSAVRAAAPPWSAGTRTSGEPTTVTAADYPGRTGGSVEQATQKLDGSQQQVVSPPGGVPTAMTSLPGGRGPRRERPPWPRYPLAVLPGQSAVFTSEVLQQPQNLLGSGRIRLDVTSSTTSATLFVSLWDLGPDTTAATPTPGTGSGGGAGAGGGTGTGEPTGLPQTAVLPQSVVAPVHLVGLTPDRASTVDVALPAVAHQVPVGHRLRVVVSSTDQAYANRKDGAVYDVTVAGPAALTLPRLPSAQVAPQTLDVPLPLLLVVSALVLAAVLGALLLGRRERAGVVREDLRGVPLVVEDLEKTYARRAARRSTASRSAPSPARSSGCSDPTGPARRR